MNQVHASCEDEEDSEVYNRKGLWYHPDESWAEEFGPFTTRGDAVFSLRICRLEWYNLLVALPPSVR